MNRAIQRANRILEIAIGMCGPDNWAVRNRLEEIHLYHDETNVYAERGYKGLLAATGNWNEVYEYLSPAGSQRRRRHNRTTRQRKPVPNGNLPTRVENLLVKLGFECEWSDEWAACEECSRIFRTQPDCYDWKPSYKESESECLCLDCHRANQPEEEEEDEDEESE